MNIGDLVVQIDDEKRVPFCIIDFHVNKDGEKIAILKGLFNYTLIVEAPVTELNSLLIDGVL